MPLPNSSIRSRLDSVALRSLPNQREEMRDDTHVADLLQVDHEGRGRLLGSARSRAATHSGDAFARGNAGVDGIDETCNVSSSARPSAPMRAYSAGTKEPTWASRTMRAIDLR